MKNRKRKAKALRLRVFSVSCCTAAGAPRFVISPAAAATRRVLSYLLPRLRHAAFCHISCRGCDMPRFVISLPRLRHAAFCHISCCGCSAAFCHTPAALRLRRRVLSYLCRGYETLRFAISPAAIRCVLPCSCRAAAATRCVLSYSCRGWGAVFCQTPATLPSVMHRRCSLPPG